MNNNSLRTMRLGSKIAVIILIILVISFLVGIFFLGFAGLFDLFGVQYDSYYSLFIFILFYLFLGSIFDLFSSALITLSLKTVLGKIQSFITRMTIDCTFNWVPLYTVDEFMTSITIPFSVEIIAVLLLFFADVAFEDKETS